MEWSELVRKYKDGSAAPQERALVEEELEKQQQLNDLLYSEIEREFSAESGFEREGLPLAPDRHDAEAFTKIVQRAIRRAFLKAGAVITAIVLSLTLFICYGLSPIVDMLYYDPAGKVFWDTGSEEGSYSPQLGSDMGTYTELRCPLRRFDDGSVFRRGYGVYDFRLHQSVVPSSLKTGSLNGTIRRGDIVFYNPELAERFSMNSFANYTTEGRINSWQESEWNRWEEEQVKKKIEAMRPEETAEAYVSFTHLLSFEELQRLKEETGSPVCWNLVITDDLRNDTTGYSSAFSGSFGYYDVYTFNYEKTNVPTVRVFSREDEEKTAKSEAFAKEQFLRMLDYLAQQTAFLEMMDDRPEHYQQAAEYVRRQGLSFGGLAVCADREQLQKLIDHPLVSMVKGLE